MLAELPAQDRQHQPLQLGIRGVEDDELRQERGDERGERTRERGPGTIGLGHAGGDRVAEGIVGEETLELVHESGDGVVELDAPGRLTGGLSSRRISEGTDLTRLVEHGRRPHFSEVVIVGRDPEDGNHRTLPALLDQTRDFDRGQGLVEDEQGTPQETRLLAGDDGGGPRLRQQGRAGGRARSSPRLLLPGQDVRELSGLSRLGERPLTRRDDRVEVEAASVVEGGRGRTAGQVVAEELALWVTEGPIVQDPDGASRHCSGIIEDHSRDIRRNERRGSVFPPATPSSTVT